MLTTTQLSCSKNLLGFGVGNSGGLEHPHLATQVTAAAHSAPHSYSLQHLGLLTFHHGQKARP